MTCIESVQLDIARSSQRHINMNHKLLILSIILSMFQSLWLGINTKNSDSLNIDTSLVLERTLHVKLVVIELVALRHVALELWDNMSIHNKKELAYKIAQRVCKEIPCEGVLQRASLVIDSLAMVLYLISLLSKSNQLNRYWRSLAGNW